MDPVRSAAIFLLAASCCTVPHDNTPRVKSQLNVWRLQATSGSGSASPIRVTDTEVWFLTARHMQPSNAWSVKDRYGNELLDGFVVEAHPTEDALILAFPLPDYHYPPPQAHSLGYAPLEIGDTCYGSGFAGGYMHQWLTVGLVSGPDRVTSQIALGDSGGGLFDESGDLRAILAGHFGKSHMASVVPLHNIEEWLRRMVDSSTVSTSK